MLTGAGVQRAAADHLDRRGAPWHALLMRLSPALLGLTLAAAASSGTLAAGRDDRVFAACEAARADQLALLAEVVNIDSGTGDAAGAARVQATVGARLKALGAAITLEGVVKLTGGDRPRSGFALRSEPVSGSSGQPFVAEQGDEAATEATSASPQAPKRA